ncbi:PDR/VanB family oxidoreductase [Leifsonia kafniensis]|uniref:PDR/VanB family oxidoreductase n=1 Tax=Leifsonia kafniensis TaxID=475957 RepID=A0ABP7KP48_9MICO
MSANVNEAIATISRKQGARAPLDGEPLTIRARRDVSDSVVEIEFVNPDGFSLSAWKPGAHLELTLPNGLVRQYSLCSDPDEIGSYRVAVLKDPRSRGGSAFIHDEVREGDVLMVSGPRNNFEFVEAPDYHFVAAGIGITPMIPMIEHAERTGATWKLSYLGRSRASMAYSDSLASRYPNKVDIRPDDEFGFPNLPALLGEPRDNVKIYACGPEGVLKALEGIVSDVWPADTLRLERFAPNDAEALTKNRTSFTVKLTLSGLEFEVPEGRNIVEVAEEAGASVIYSCMEGTCGTCETRIVCGEADHRDSILTDDEKNANEMMMICVSRAKSARLELEL